MCKIRLFGKSLPKYAAIFAETLSGASLLCKLMGRNVVYKDQIYKKQTKICLKYVSFIKFIKKSKKYKSNFFILFNQDVVEALSYVI